MSKLCMEKYLEILPPNYARIYKEGLLHNWNIEAGWKNLEINTPLRVIDMTLRDGEQQPGVYFTPDQKLEIFKKMEQIGFFGGEIGFPAVSEDEKKACKLMYDENPKGLFFVMARAKKRDIDDVIDVGATAVDVITSSSDFHIQYKQKLDRESNIEKYLEMVDYVVDHDLKLVFGREDCSRADYKYMCQFIVKVKERAGNNFAGYALSDTVGAMTPPTVKWWLQTVSDELSKLGHPELKPLTIHCHNDLGLAVANSLASIEWGCSGVNGSMTGIGERAGNAALEELIIILQCLLGIDMNIDLEEMFELAKLVSKYSGIPIPVNKPVIGANAFKHESGIHTAGQLAHSHVYEEIPHEWLGRQSIYRYGKFSGTQLILKEALEPFGIRPNKKQLYDLAMEVKREQIRRGKEQFENFVDTYNQIMEAMGMTIEDVMDIAKKIGINDEISEFQKVVIT
ncbi:MAG: hypothetical protein EAX96_10015 [Candidatus Lokiarchaeota archaeon]|nr:hypothetical protein [Candidatus Lokiarchaeota archaeon]